jgi:hypothetical protein
VWTWLVPLVAALCVFSGVLLTTPPGFGAFTDLLSQPRGARAEAVAYVLGAAASLALITLLVLWAVCAMLDALVRRRVK